jgi:acetylornithine/succinyldiaminopimelate/putrescine aminotransferase
LVTEFLEKGFVVNCTQGDILRFVPPLIITKEQIDAFSEVLLQTLIGWDPGQVEK